VILYSCRRSMMPSSRAPLTRIAAPML
jgi:hypothetical protein